MPLPLKNLRAKVPEVEGPSPGGYGAATAKTPGSARPPHRALDDGGVGLRWCSVVGVERGLQEAQKNAYLSPNHFNRTSENYQARSPWPGRRSFNSPSSRHSLQNTPTHVHRPAGRETTACARELSPLPEGMQGMQEIFDNPSNYKQDWLVELIGKKDNCGDRFPCFGAQLNFNSVE
jgi:hypothetical protein